MNKTESALQILKCYSYLGEMQLNDGTLLIGNAPHIAPQAWLHTIYPPIGDIELNEIEKNVRNTIPADYKKFLQKSNGLNVFNTALSLYGLRKNFRRSTADAWQPFSIITPNTLERPAGAGSNIFFIGSYDWDGSRLYINSKTQSVHLSRRDDIQSLYEWENFEEMLQFEVSRLVTLFDKNGEELDPNESTLPCDY